MFWVVILALLCLQRLQGQLKALGRGACVKSLFTGIAQQKFRSVYGRFIVYRFYNISEGGTSAKIKISLFLLAFLSDCAPDMLKIGLCLSHLICYVSVNRLLLAWKKLVLCFVPALDRTSNFLLFFRLHVVCQDSILMVLFT